MAQLKIVVDEVAGQYRARICQEVPAARSPYGVSPEKYLYDTRLVDVVCGNKLHPNKDAAYESAKQALVTFNIKQ